MNYFQTLRQIGRPIAYFPELARLFGGVNAAILFGQIFYWQERCDDELGVYKTIAQLEEETGLTEREQKTACDKLEKLEVLTKTNKRLQHRMYYKLNESKFNELMAQFAEQQNRSSRTDKSAVRETTKARLDEPTNPQFAEQQNVESYKEHRLHTENTHRLHTESLAATMLPPAVDVVDVEILDTETLTAADKNSGSLKTANAQTWQAYRNAYLQRYGIEPLRNAKVNGQIAQFVKTVGAQDAPALAAYYVAHNLHFFVQRRHDFGLLLQSAQQVRTDWLTGQQMTRQQAQQTEKTQQNLNTHDEALAMLKVQGLA
ncbi:hypothetical protein [Kingella negevensis]|uniref:hypothetical protein n=1 Tax=Kingella negevensis TaxID=1522312 RepID=UPI000693E472|nr:hypothetical protein [Kingella negevensis]